MSIRPVGRCSCGHVKSIHRNMIYKPKKRWATRDCNFPGCKCREYRRASSPKSKGGKAGVR